MPCFAARPTPPPKRRWVARWHSARCRPTAGRKRELHQRVLSVRGLPPIDPGFTDLPFSLGLWGRPRGKGRGPQRKARPDRPLPDSTKVRLSTCFCCAEGCQGAVCRRSSILFFDGLQTASALPGAPRLHFALFP